MENPPSNGLTSVVRWAAWLILCIGMATEMFFVRNAGLAIFNRVQAEQIMRKQDAGIIVDSGQAGSLIQLNQVAMMFVVGIIAVTLSVMLDYYLRAGQRNGHLWQRIGLAAVVEAGIFGLAMLVQVLV